MSRESRDRRANAERLTIARRSVRGVFSQPPNRARSSFVGTIITLVILAAVVWYAISIYNNLVNSRNRVGNAFSQIDVQLTRRYDLIPESRRSRQGLHGPRARHARGRHQRPQRGVSRPEESRGRSVRSGRHQSARRSRGDSRRHARPLVRAGRGVSRSQGQSEHAATPRRADVDREQGRVRASGVQRRRAELQQRLRELPRQPDREQLRLQGGRVSRDRAAEKRAVPKVSFN